jgi:hypothetical protein
MSEPNLNVDIPRSIAHTAPVQHEAVAVIQFRSSRTLLPAHQTQSFINHNTSHAKNNRPR